MTWDEYYEKSGNWSASTSVNRMSQLEELGPSDEMAEVIAGIGYEDKKGATRLLNKAIQKGIKFSGGELLEIWDYCDSESLDKAIKLSADAFTTTDLEDLSLCMDDEQIIELVKKYKIDAPKDIYDEYEEILCPDTSTSISWNRFYEAYLEWNAEYAVKRSKSLTEYGDEDEVMDVVQELFSNDVRGASEFIQDALACGVKFTTDNLVELTCLCDEETIELAVMNSSVLFTENDLEELYGNIEDRIIKKVAKKRKLRLPEAMREESDDCDTYQAHNVGGFLQRLFSRKSKQPIFSEEECFLYGIHPDDERYRKTMELDILSKDYRND